MARIVISALAAESGVEQKFMALADVCGSASVISDLSSICATKSTPVRRLALQKATASSKLAKQRARSIDAVSPPSELMNSVVSRFRKARFMPGQRGARGVPPSAESEREALGAYSSSV